jgi:hypothetical protein
MQYNSNFKCLFSPSLVALDIVLNNTKKKTKKKIKLNHNNSKLDTSPRERFVIFSTQVPDTLTNTPKDVKMQY